MKEEKRKFTPIGNRFVECNMYCYEAAIATNSKGEKVCDKWNAPTLERHVAVARFMPHDLERICITPKLEEDNQTQED